MSPFETSFARIRQLSSKKASRSLESFTYLSLSWYTMQEASSKRERLSFCRSFIKSETRKKTTTAKKQDRRRGSSLHLLVVLGHQDVFQVVELELVHHLSCLLINRNKDLLQLGPPSNE